MFDVLSDFFSKTEDWGLSTLYYSLSEVRYPPLKFSTLGVGTVFRYRLFYENERKGGVDYVLKSGVVSMEIIKPTKDLLRKGTRICLDLY